MADPPVLLTEEVELDRFARFQNSNNNSSSRLRYFKRVGRGVSVFGQYPNSQNKKVVRSSLATKKEAYNLQGKH